jgi:cellulase/cellobiase CelA1
VGQKALENKQSEANFRTEPDSLANLVTNMGVSKCANAHDAYLECTNYAVTQLNLDNVAMYLDAGEYYESGSN